MVSTDFKMGLKGVTGMISTLASILAWFEGLRICKHVFDPQNRAYGFVSKVFMIFSKAFWFLMRNQCVTNALPS